MIVLQTTALQQQIQASFNYDCQHSSLSHANMRIKIMAVAKTLNVSCIAVAIENTNHCNSCNIVAFYSMCTTHILAFEQQCSCSTITASNLCSYNVVFIQLHIRCNQLQIELHCSCILVASALSTLQNNYSRVNSRLRV